jgi:glutamate-1-semialdehyde 2,1-aminomutase
MIGRVKARLLLSKAKHPSLRGHARISQQVARLLPLYEYGEDEFFSTDGAPADVVRQRRAGFERLARTIVERAPKTLQLSREVASGLSDVSFVNAYRVPFQFRRYVASHLAVGCFSDETQGPRIRDLDGNWAYDLGGSYGVNLFGQEFYKQCMDRGFERARALGVTLGSYHPVVAENVKRLKEISGLDEVSFHMSGTEAVMQAVRLARYHTGRSHLVRFCGAYHGWWDGVQVGVGNPRPPRDVYTLKEMDADTLSVLETRDDIACVLVNSIQAMHPNASPPSDSTLIASDRTAQFDKAGYRRWLAELRDVCTRRNIPLIIDDVFMGFRLALGGSQEYFGVRADLVTYGKTLGGGLPVGVLCGRRNLMRRFRDDLPGDVCFARGTFNSHPVVMATMNEFLRSVDEEPIRETYRNLDQRWNERAKRLNDALSSRGLPVRVVNMTSVWTTVYVEPSRYNWMLQYYLRAEGLSPSWIGTGRFIFSHDLKDHDFSAIADRFVAAAERMRDDGWSWHEGALSNDSIKRRVFREVLSAAALRAVQPLVRERDPSGPATPPSSNGAAPSSTSQYRGTGPSGS